MPTVVQKKQPPGLEGARFTAREAVALAKKYQDDPTIRSWVSHAVMHSCPNLDARDMKPSAQVKRAACLFEALRDASFVGSSGWMPDQTGRENLDSPVLTLGDGTTRPFFAANDCSNRALALVAAMLTCLNMIDCPVVLLAHGYSPGNKRVEHILLAVAQVGQDERGNPIWKKVWRMDPSQDKPFGEVMPFSWEYVVDAATGNVICDDKECLVPGSPKIGKVAKVAAGAGGHVDLMNVTSGIQIDDADMPNTAGLALAEKDGEWWSDELALFAKDIREAVHSFEVYADAAARILTAGGVTLPSWTEEKQGQALTTLAAANLAAMFLQEASEGKRGLGLSPEGQWWIESLPADQQALGGTANSFWIEDRATGNRQVVNVASGNRAGIIDKLVIGAVAVAGIALWAGVAFVIYRAIVAWENTAHEAATIVVSQTQAKCLEQNDAAACARLETVKAELERARNAARVESERTAQGLTDLAKYLVVGFIGVGLFFGAKWAWEQTTRGGRSKNPGGPRPKAETHPRSGGGEMIVGHAYQLDGKGWKTSQSDDWAWDAVYVDPDAEDAEEPVYVGRRTVHGQACRIFRVKVGGGHSLYFAQSIDGSPPRESNPPKMTPAGREFMSAEIRHLINDKGYEQKRAVAAAYNIARKKGYKVPRAA